jgi:hypothetical protein
MTSKNNSEFPPYVWYGIACGDAGTHVGRLSDSPLEARHLISGNSCIG